MAKPIIGADLPIVLPGAVTFFDNLIGRQDVLGTWIEETDGGVSGISTLII